MTLVDTNVLSDVVTGNPLWAPWSLRQLKIAALAGPLMINAVIYAELSVQYDRIGDLDTMLSVLVIRLEPIPLAALFQAGKAFKRYRILGGTRAGVLPDFFIGAHAAAQDPALLTRDTARFRDYFPTIRLITQD